jgi:putative DNA primase/helicase
VKLPRGTDLFKAGVENLVSILPPVAPFPAAGKAPGYWDGSQWRMTPGWQKLVATEEAVRQWGEAGANVGVLARFWPAFDVDTEEEFLRDLLVEIIHRLVGRNGLERDSRHPRKLLAFRADTPGEISKHSLRFKKGDGPVQALEALGDGNQWVASGVHPSGSQYLTEWNAEPVTRITMDDVQNVLREAEEMLVALGYEIVHRGSTTKTDRANVDQDGLKGRLEEVRDLIVNRITNDVDWDGWIQHGYAIKGALSEHPNEAHDLWLQFTLSNPVGTVEEAEYQWSRMRPPFALGIDYLRGRAPGGGLLQALADFTFLPPVVRPPELEAGAGPGGAEEVPGGGEADGGGAEEGVHAPARDIRREVYAYSDQELARRLLNTPMGRSFRHAAGTWYVWDGMTWLPDEEEKWISSLVQDYLREITIEVMGTELPGREKDSIAKRIDGLAGSRAVVGLLASRRELNTHPDHFDPDDHLLNTPIGVIDLTTGAVRPHEMGLMCSMCTAVAPRKEFAFRWLKFIDELTEGDTELARYLQKLAGYSLIGLNDLELLQMLIGAGGNGKSSYTETLVEAMGSYGATLPQGTFTSSKHGGGGSGDAATPSLALLRGKRLVVTSETNAGRWDEEKAKAWTGGERVTARALYSKPFTFKPKFTVIMTANTPPILTDAGPAWERRLRVIPCDFIPKVYEAHFKAHLMAEGPEVLQWAIDGAVLYHKEGLGTPEAILEATSEYFEVQDTLGAWLSVCAQITGKDDDFVLASTLLDSYNGWAVTRSERTFHNRPFGTAMKKKAQALDGVRYSRRGPNGDRGYAGLRLIKGTGDLST